MQFVDAIEQSISLLVLPVAPPAATQRKSWRWPESLLWTAESELREDATTGSMLFNPHSFSDDHCCRYITRRLCLARARHRHGPSRICSCTARRALLPQARQGAAGGPPAPTALRPGAVSCRGAPRLALQRHFLNPGCVAMRVVHEHLDEPAQRGGAGQPPAALRRACGHRARRAAPSRPTPPGTLVAAAPPQDYRTRACQAA